MNAPSPRRTLPKPARLAAWARLWLSCIAALLSCATNLPPALQRRLPLLDLPTRVVARHVARLILLCALDQAHAPKRAWRTAPGQMRALLRAGAQRFLTNAHGAYDLAIIVRTCAEPDAAIAHMIATLECGFTRRTPILPRAAFEPLTSAARNTPLVCDTS